MTRRVVNILTVLSALLCLAVVALWVRSYWRSDAFGFQQRCSEQDPRGDYWLYSTRGRLTLYTALIGLSDKDTGPFWNTGPASNRRRTEGRGSYVLVWDLDHYPSFATVSTPHWVPVAALLAAPAVVAWGRFRRRRRQFQGHCLNCGYDLRATPDQCPECGHRASAAR